MITVIANNKSTQVNMCNLNNELWIHKDDVKKSTGFELKPSGACYEKLDICIPLFEDGYKHTDEKGEWLNMSKLANTLDMACVSNSDKSVWSLGIIPQERANLLETRMAPDFEIEDINGEIIRLSDFRGKKVLIVTWATWCGCRFDVKSWQNIYEELNDSNFEIISVAEDSQGKKVAKKWFDEANAKFKCIVDETHKISTLFGWVNVPTGAWIDEEGKIVRVNEAAYAEEHEMKNLIASAKFGDSAFGNATKEWVKNGLNEKIAQSTESMHKNIKATSKTDFLADAYFQLALYFQKNNDNKTAQIYFKKAQELSPDNWNFSRQGWTFKSTFHASIQWLKKNNKKLKESSDWHYYEPKDLPNSSTKRSIETEYFWKMFTNKK